jgi:hypothetical protein
LGPVWRPEINSDFAMISANRRCGSSSLQPRRHHRCANLSALSKINDLTLIVVQNWGKKVALRYISFSIVTILSPSTTVNTITPVTHHNAIST